MNNVVVWLNSDEAYVYAMKTSGIEKAHLKKESIDHHRRHKKDTHTDSNAQRYYYVLVFKFKGTD